MNESSVPELNHVGNPYLICVKCGSQIKNRSGRRHKYCTWECYLTIRDNARGKHPFFKTWKGMMYRCYRKNDPSYGRYGGRGITVCDDWHDFELFCEWAETQNREPGMTLDRRDNDSNYSPDNCHFATPSQQQRNRQDTVFVTAFGETKPRAAWLEDSRCVVGKETLLARLRSGVDSEIALTTPPTSGRTNALRAVTEGRQSKSE